MGQWAAAAPWAVKRPKLVVVIVIDQFRADYISRFQSQFVKTGFNALIQSGAYFPYGEYDLLQSVTGPGHATVLTGAYPYQMGIPLNEWFDQKSNAKTYCVDDHAVSLVGAKGPGEGVSPKNLVGSTLGDELKNIDLPSKVVALALKDRAAILLGGHRADLAFWFDDDHWISSTYYRKDGKLPAWLEKHNATVMKSKCQLEAACGAELTAAAFVAALEGENMGRGPSIDILAVSFSGHDFAGHKFGPNAPEMKAVTLAEDRAISKMREAVAKQVPGGLKDVVFVLTGDHGVAPTPEYLAKTGIETGRLNYKDLSAEIDGFLTKKYGAPTGKKWIEFVEDFNFFISEDSVHARKADLAQVEKETKEIIARNPGFAFVMTRAEYEASQFPPGMFERKMKKTFYRGRSGNVIAIQKPFYINAGKAANHMTGYVYDRTVPIIFSGFGIKNGLYSEKAEVVDIAPTLAFLLGILPPALSEGKVLGSALK